MEYTLKLFDTSLLGFQVIENLADPVVRINWIDNYNRKLLPLDMEPNETGLVRW